MLLIYTIIYWACVGLYYLKHNYIASVMMISLAIFLFVSEIRKSKHLVTVRGLFALGFIGGFGLSLLKLSRLSADYSLMTFVVVFVSYFSLYLGVVLRDKGAKNNSDQFNYDRRITNKLFTNQQLLVVILLIVTFLAFIIEAMMLGFVPLFTKDTPHAYSAFHVFMLHYITTFYAFIPCIAIANYFENKAERLDIILIIISFVYLVIMSLFMVSRSQLILSLALSILIVIIYKIKNVYEFRVSKFGILKLITFAIIFIVLYGIITIYRAHNIEYLNGIFEMKNENTPIFITQPYMYVAHNFENLNYMINNIFRFTCGRRMLYPLFTLTFIKKLFPIVVDSPYYIIKQELSTVTLVYDAYYDFGIIGVICFCFIIGYIGKMLEDKAYAIVNNTYNNKNNYIEILFAQYSYFMIFSFFQTYFSLTDTWVHIIFIYLLFKFIVMNKKEGA